LYRPIRIRIRLLSAPDLDPNPNAFGFGSELKLSLKTKSKLKMYPFFYVFMIGPLKSKFSYRMLAEHWQTEAGRGRGVGRCTAGLAFGY